MRRFLIAISILTTAGCTADPIGPTVQSSITSEVTEVDARRIRGDIDGATDLCQITAEDISHCPWRLRLGDERESALEAFRKF